jgi:hypothetical protein
MTHLIKHPYVYIVLEHAYSDYIDAKIHGVYTDRSSAEQKKIKSLIIA